MSNRIRDFASVVLFILFVAATPFGLAAVHQSGLAVEFVRSPLIE